MASNDTPSGSEILMLTRDQLRAIVDEAWSQSRERREYLHTGTADKIVKDALKGIPEPTESLFYNIATECVQNLDKAGCGALGKPNTLLAMVNEIIERAQTNPINQINNLVKDWNLPTDNMPGSVATDLIRELFGILARLARARYDTNVLLSIFTKTIYEETLNEDRSLRITEQQLELAFRHHNRDALWLPADIDMEAKQDTYNAVEKQHLKGIANEAENR